MIIIDHDNTLQVIKDKQSERRPWEELEEYYQGRFQEYVDCEMDFTEASVLVRQHVIDIKQLQSEIGHW